MHVERLPRVCAGLLGATAQREQFGVLVTHEAETGVTLIARLRPGGNGRRVRSVPPRLPAYAQRQ